MPIMVDQSQSAANLQMFLSAYGSSTIMSCHEREGHPEEAESTAHSGELIHVDAGNRVEEFEGLNDCAGYKRNVGSVLRLSTGGHSLERSLPKKEPMTQGTKEDVSSRASARRADSCRVPLLTLPR